MYKVKEVEIKNFWGRHNAKCAFNSNVNIIIGKNGTGKTTFMNILHAALSVDIEELANNEFESINIILELKGKKKTIKVKKTIPSVGITLPIIEYQISRRKYTLRVVPIDDRRIPQSFRKRVLDECNEIRNELAEVVSLSSLSVYRLRGGDDFEIKDRSGKRLISPVDFRLTQLKSELTQYQLELSQAARTISTTLQKDVLATILYADETYGGVHVPKGFDKAKEHQKLTSAYIRLNALDTSVEKKISYHLNAVDEAMQKLNAATKSKKFTADINFTAIESFFRTQKIIGMSLTAEEEIKKIFSPIEQFTVVLHKFIQDKKFIIESGELRVYGGKEEIPIDKLSSGEKQLLILLIETLLQKNKPYVYLTDEPELSLHIEWQRNILPAIKELNPHAQIISATHSPEVASKYRNSLIDMSSVVYD